MQLCKLDSSVNKFLEEWDYDFHLFKIQCKTARPEIELSNKEENEMQSEFKEKIVKSNNYRPKQN